MTELESEKIEMKAGDFVIHWADCPNDTMIARLTHRADGLWHGVYMNNGFRDEPPEKRSKWACSGGSSLVSDFGRDVILEDDEFKAVPNGKPSGALYPDGKIRKWQGA